MSNDVKVVIKTGEENRTKIKYRPTQGIKTKTSTVYLWDPSFIGTVGETLAKADALIEKTTDLDKQVQEIQETVDNQVKIINDPEYKLVGENINTIKATGENISQVNTVASNIDDVKAVSDSIESVEIVGENITEVKAVAGSIVKVQEVANNRTNIDTVANNITDVGTVAENIDVIKDAPYFVEKTQDYAEKAKLYAETAKGLPVFAEFTTNRIEPSINGAYEKNGQIFDADDFTGPDNPYKLITEGKVPSIDLTEKVYNLPAIEGNPTIENGVISGFTKTDYARICIPSPREQFEIIIKFNTPNLSSVQSLLEHNDPTSIKDYKALILRLGTNGLITCWCTRSGSGWDLLNNYQFTGVVFEANKDQYMKFEWKNGNYAIAKSEDGENWSYCNNVATSLAPIVSMDEVIGMEIENNLYPFKGTIDLKEFKITIDNKVYWQYEYANEYEKQLALTGGCNKFGLDTVNRKFRLPTAKCREIVSQNTIGSTSLTLYSDGYIKYKIHLFAKNTSYGSKDVALPIEMANTEYLVYGISRNNTSFSQTYNLQIINKKTNSFLLGYIVAYPDGEICVEGYSASYHNVLRKMIQLSSEAKEMTSLEDYTNRIEKKANEEIAKVNLTGLDNKANKNFSNITEEAKEVITHTGHFSYADEDKILIPSQPWIAPADGYVVDSGFIGNTSWWFTVNGTNYILVGDNATGGTMNHIHIEVKEGDSLNSFITTTSRFFFPKKV